MAPTTPTSSVRAAPRPGDRASPPLPAALPAALPPLEPGDHLDQPTFHARYAAMPPQTRAELLGGTVYMPSPAKVDHSEHYGVLIGWLWTYKRATPGTRVFNNGTVKMGPENEPQPDAFLVISRGGQTYVDDEVGCAARRNGKGRYRPARNPTTFTPRSGSTRKPG